MGRLASNFFGSVGSFMDPYVLSVLDPGKFLVEFHRVCPGAPTFVVNMLFFEEFFEQERYLQDIVNDAVSV